MTNDVSRAAHGPDVLTLCLDRCDPLTQDCDPSDTCVSVDASFVCLPQLDDPVAEGGPCQVLNACVAGAFCAAATTAECDVDTGCCAAVCDLTIGNEQCAGFAMGETCQPWFEEGKSPGLQTVGVCVL
ncbi:MAG: hypothetical protein AAF721_03455 [Myxococcota bacterium]